MWLRRILTEKKEKKNIANWKLKKMTASWRENFDVSFRLSFVFEM